MRLTEHTLGQIIDDIWRLHIDAEKIIITGSVALCAYGLKQEFNDVDIIVINPTKGSWSDLLSNYSQGSKDYDSVKVKCKDYHIDVLRDDLTNEHPIVSLFGDDTIYLSTLDCIIKAKRKLNRDKDRKDFEDMLLRLKSMVVY